MRGASRARRGPSRAAAVALVLAAACVPDFRSDIPCDGDDDCPARLYCIAGLCGDPDDAPCTSNLDCEEDAHCDPERAVCVDGAQPVPR